MATSAAPTTPARRPAADEIPALLEPIVRQKIPGAGDNRITNWQATDRGMSTETFLFDVQCDGAGGPTTLKQLVFRRPPAVSLFPDYDLLRQVLVMNRLQVAPITVPRVWWLDRDDRQLGTPYYVMEQLPTVGSPSDFPSYHSQGMYFDATPEQRATMWWGCVQSIADVHALDWRRLGLDRLLMPQHGAHPLEQVVNYYSDMLQWASSGDPRPELAAATKWLRDNTMNPSSRSCAGVTAGRPTSCTGRSSRSLQSSTGSSHTSATTKPTSPGCCSPIGRARNSKGCRASTAHRAAGNPSHAMSSCPAGR